MSLFLLYFFYAESFRVMLEAVQLFWVYFQPDGTFLGLYVWLILTSSLITDIPEQDPLFTPPQSSGSIGLRIYMYSMWPSFRTSEGLQSAEINTKSSFSIQETGVKLTAA